MKLLRGCVLILLAAVAFLSMQKPVFSQDPCNGLVASRLHISETARVVYNGDGLGSEVRNNAGKETSGSQFIGVVPEGTVVTLLDGPVCLDAAVWWKVSLTDGTEAWIAEGDRAQYFLEKFVLGAEVIRPDTQNSHLLRRSFVTYSGEVSELPGLEIPAVQPTLARDIWQQPDLDAANAELGDRRARCPQVLEGTPWQNITTAGEVLVPEGSISFVPAPDGVRVLLVRHRVLQIPTCGGGPGNYFGISTVHLLSEGRQTDLFPYGQYGGVRSRVSCMSPDVANAGWATDLSEIVWSPDGDTVALSVRYLEQGTDQRLCAYYYIYLVDVFNAVITPVAEGRRLFWGGGGTRLYYISFVVDNASYNVQQEQLMVLSEGQSDIVNVPILAGAQFVPGAFNSTGVVLPANSTGTRALVCNTLSGCPATLEFDLTRSTFSDMPLAIPDNLLPRQITQVRYVADDTRLLWLTTEGKVYIQSLRDPDMGVWVAVALTNVASPEAKVTSTTLLPTGVAVVLKLDTGDYVLLNTISRDVQLLPALRQ